MQTLGHFFEPLYLSNSTSSEAALVSSTLSAPFEKPVKECAGLGKDSEGPGLDIEHWEVTACVVREIGSEPVAIREISDAERKRQVVGGFALCRSPCQLESMDAVGHVLAGVHGGASADKPIDGVADLMNIMSHGGTDPQGDISMLGNMEALFSNGIYRATDSLFCDSQFSSFISPLQTFPFSFPILPSIPTHRPLSPSFSQPFSPCPLIIPNYLLPNHLHHHHHHHHSYSPQISHFGTPLMSS